MNDISWGPIKETDVQQFCVEMMKRLDVQRRNDHFCDVILEVGCGDDQARLKAHRIVLCAASPFFYNALNSEMKEKKEGVPTKEPVIGHAIAIVQLFQNLCHRHLQRNDKAFYQL